MKKFNFLNPFLLTPLFFFLFNPKTSAQIDIHAPDIFLCVGDDFTQVGNVYINETSNSDINNTDAIADSIIIQRPGPNFIFKAENLSLTEFNAGTTSNSTTAYATDTSIVLKYTMADTENELGDFTLSGLEIKAINASASGNAIRSGGNAFLNGFGINSVFFSVASFDQPPAVNSQPEDQYYCQGNQVSFTISSADAQTFKWQINQGGGFTDLNNNADFSGATTNTLTVNPNSGLNNAAFRCILSNACGSTTSSQAILYPNQSTDIISGPETQFVCSGTSATFSVSANGAQLTYKWYENDQEINLGNGNFSGQNTESLSITTIYSWQNGYRYHVEVSNSCGSSVVSSQAFLIVTDGSATINGLESQYCPNGGPDTLKGFPTGGTFSGNGIKNISEGVALFYPDSVLDNSNHSITYEVQKGNCDATVSQNTFVRKKSTNLEITSPATDSISLTSQDSLINLKATPEGGMFSGIGVGFNNGVYNFSPANLSDGFYTITYSLNDGTCLNKVSKTIAINNLPGGEVLIPELKTKYCSSANSHPITWINEDSVNIKIIVTNPLVVSEKKYPLISISGPGVYGNLEDGFIFQPDSASSPQNGGSGLKKLTVIYQTDTKITAASGVSYGTEIDTLYQYTTVNRNPVLSFETLSLSGDTIPFEKYYCTYDPGMKLKGNFPGTNFLIANRDVVGDTLRTDNFVPSQIGPKNVDIIFRYTDPNTNCFAQTNRTTSIIGTPPTPQTDSLLTYCTGETIENLLAINQNQEFLIRWYNDNSTLIGEGNSFDPEIINQESSQNTYYVSTQHKESQCESSAKQVKVIINPTPVLSFSGLAESYCVSEDKDTLSGFPAGSGGRFTGSGIIDLGNGKAVLDPTIFKDNVNSTITYTFTNTFNCSNSTSQSTKINLLPLVSLANLDSAYCQDPNLAIDLNGAPAGGSYTINNLAAGQIFRPSDYDKGSYVINYSYQNQTTGCSNDTSISVTLNALPQPGLSLSSRCRGDNIQFLNETLIETPDLLKSIFWDFGNGQSSEEENPVYQYQFFGKYKVQLEVVSELGCQSTMDTIVDIEPFPVSDFDWTDICQEDQTSFINLSTIDEAYNISSYEWDFGDGYSISGLSGQVTGGTNDGTTEGTYFEPVHRYSETGIYTAKLTVVSRGNCSASLEKEFHVLPKIEVSNDDPYYEDFENLLNPDGGYVAFGVNNSWQFGMPDKPGLTGANSGSHAWVTKLDTVYYNNEKSYVDFPCFVFNNLDRPYISLNYFTDLQSSFDGAVLQYSINGGRSWDNIGALGEGINWFNQNFLVANPGEQEIRQKFAGWSGQTKQWKNARNILDYISSGDETIRLRIAFATDATNPPNTNMAGFAFDDIFIGNRERIVLVEHFSNLNEASAIDAGNNVYGVINNKIKDVVAIEYHTSFPGIDVLNRDNIADPSARVQFYGVGAVPKTYIDGQETAGLSELQVSKNSLYDPSCNIDLSTETVNGLMSIAATITAADTIPDDITLKIAIIERVVTVETGEVNYDFQWVLKKMAPNAAGKTFFRDWLPGDSEIYTTTWNGIPQAYDTSQIGVVAFLQNNNTREILNAQFISGSGWTVTDPVGLHDFTTSNITLYPNPASDLLFINNTGLETLNWSVSDQMGRSIISGSTFSKDQSKVDTSSLPEGIYLFKILSKQENITNKIIISR